MVHKRIWIVWVAGLLFPFMTIANELKTLITSDWMSVDDRVMGGVSVSQMLIQDNKWIFYGDLSLENNGGFASVRSLINLEGVDDEAVVKLRVKGDGKRYQLRFRTNRYMDGVAYAVSLDTVADQVLERTFSLQDFRPVWRGRLVPNAPNLQWQEVNQLGFMISNKQSGEFAMEVYELAWLNQT